MRNGLFRHSIRCGCVLVVLAATISSGCAQLDLKETFANPFKSGDDDPHMPSRILAVWVETVRFTQGQTPVRGFGGRVMFYQHGEDEPIKVEGDLVVYAFDENGRKPTDPRPSRKYVFSADQLEAHYSKSKVGHSYSFFVPWDNVGGLRKEISLIVRFQPELGPPIASEQTRHILPGKPVPEETQVADPGPGTDGEDAVRPASYQQGAPHSAQPEKPRERMQTTTISLESEFGQRRPTAKLRPRYTRTRTTALAAQVHPESSDSSAEPPADSQPSAPRLQAEPVAPPRRDRALLKRRLAE